MRSSKPDPDQSLDDDIRCPIAGVSGGVDHVVHQGDLDGFSAVCFLRFGMQ